MGPTYSVGSVRSLGGMVPLLLTRADATECSLWPARLALCYFMSKSWRTEVTFTTGRRGATTAEKLRGTKVWAPTSGRLRPAPGQRPSWVLGAGGGRPLPLWRSGVSPPEFFLKTQMRNPAFWWLLAVKFLAFWKPRPISWGTNTLLVPNLKVAPMTGPTVVAFFCDFGAGYKTPYLFTRLFKLQVQF